MYIVHVCIIIAIYLIDVSTHTHTHRSQIHYAVINTSLQTFMCHSVFNLQFKSVVFFVPSRDRVRVLNC